MRRPSCTFVLAGLSLLAPGCDNAAPADTPAAQAASGSATAATGVAAVPTAASAATGADSGAPSPDTQAAVPTPAPQAATFKPSPLGDLAISWVPFAGGDYAMVMDNDAKTEFPVSLAPFEMSKAEITNAQYASCVQAGACTAVNYEACTDNAKKAKSLSGPKQPVACVDWAQAVAFSEWVGGALPTEAQWTFAASDGGEAGPYPWGDAKPSCKNAVMNWGCRTDASMDVCSKPAGNTKAGLCDMAGNVSELMADVAGWDVDTAKRGTKINRGGSWHGIDPLYYKNSPKGESMLRIEHRSRYGPNMRDDSMGFRPVRVLPGAKAPTGGPKAG